MKHTVTGLDKYFSKDAETAKHRFLEAARAAGATLHRAVPNPKCPDYSIDTCVLGRAKGPTLVLSSGVHGLELLFGSAVQLAFLKQLRENPDWLNNLRVVLIHAINPFGAHHLRRFDEDNIDLNRNFLLQGRSFEGCPPTYDRLNHFINPPQSPKTSELFWVKMAWLIARYGFSSLKQALAGGQYKHPDGLFFGGHGPSKSQNVLASELSAWIGGATAVAHLDFHTGLGKNGACAMLVDSGPDDPNGAWCRSTFGETETQFLAGESIAYHAQGGFGRWLQHQFPHIPYRVATAEFGTHDPIRVFRALRAENQVHHYGLPASQANDRAKKEALECFVPSDLSWRNKTVSKALEITHLARIALKEDVA